MLLFVGGDTPCIVLQSHDKLLDGTGKELFPDIPTVELLLPVGEGGIDRSPERALVLVEYGSCR